MSARPSVHSIKSEAFASASSVGFDSGKIIGRSVCAAISFTISSVKAPGCVEVPINIVGLMALTAERKVGRGFWEIHLLSV